MGCDKCNDRGFDLICSECGSPASISISDNCDIYEWCDKCDKKGIEYYIEEVPCKFCNCNSKNTSKNNNIDESMNDEAIDDLVDLIQCAFRLYHMQVEVSHNGSELIYNHVDLDTVANYYEMKKVIDNNEEYSTSDVLMAQRFFQILKEANKKVIQTQNLEDRAQFKKAGVKKITTQIDGNIISSDNYF